MLRVYVIDDETHAIELLSDYIGMTPGLELIGVSESPVKGFHEVLHDSPDILFLDIDMPVLSGLDVFRMLPPHKITVVFTTAFSNYAVDSYELDAADFLLKPIRYDRFVSCIHKLQGKRNKLLGAEKHKADDFMFVQSGVKAKIIKIKFDDITYIESLHNYQIIHMDNDRYIVYLSMKEILERLPAELFIRIHKSYIVNYSKILSVEGNRAFISQTVVLTIGNQFKDAFFEKIGQNLLRKR